MSVTQTLLIRIASQVAIFAGMGRHTLEQLLTRAEKVTLLEDELFFDEGEPGESFYVLLLGKVAVEKKSGSRWINLRELNPGDSFGEMTLIDEKIRSARVRAVTQCVTLHFQGARLRDAHEAMAVMFRNIAKMQTRRLKASSVEVADHIARRMDEDDARQRAASLAGEPAPSGSTGRLGDKWDGGSGAPRNPQSR